MALSLQTELCRRLGIEYPVFSAGLAGGPGSPELAAAISGAGGFGTLGAAYLSPSELRQAVRQIRMLTDRPFGVNLFVPTAQTEMRWEAVDVPKVLAFINEVRAEMDLNPIDQLPQVQSDMFHEQIAVLFEEKVPVIGTTFGVLPHAYRNEADLQGIRIFTMATSVDEAMEAEKNGADVIIAQGAEAGGHRGTFDVRKHPSGANVGTFALVPQVVDKVGVPVVAAGGIMDGRGLAAALALGAQAVQIGTRLLATQEAGTHLAYREALGNSVETDTTITRAFSGRPARGVNNTFIQRWMESGLTELPFPIQNALTREIRSAAAARGNSHYLSLWAGQGLRMMGSNEPAAEVLREMVSQATAIIQ